MKKCLAFIFAVGMMCSLSACGNKNTADAPTSATPAENSAQNSSETANSADNSAQNSSGGTSSSDNSAQSSNAAGSNANSGQGSSTNSDSGTKSFGYTGILNDDFYDSAGGYYVVTFKSGTIMEISYDVGVRHAQTFEDIREILTLKYQPAREYPEVEKFLSGELRIELTDKGQASDLEVAIDRYTVKGYTIKEKTDKYVVLNYPSQWASSHATLKDSIKHHVWYENTRLKSDTINSYTLGQTFFKTLSDDGSHLEVTNDKIIVTKPTQKDFRSDGTWLVTHTWYCSGNKITSYEIKTEATGAECSRLESTKNYYVPYGFTVKELTKNRLVVTSQNKNNTTKVDTVNNILKRDAYYFDNEGN